MKRLGIFVILFACLVACTPARVEVPTWWGLSPEQANHQAAHHANLVGGTWYIVGTQTASMYPYLHGGDLVVVDTAARFEHIKEGWMCIYQANWRPITSVPVCHWAAAKHGMGWIMDGQNNRNYERGKQTMMKFDFEYVNPATGRRVGGRIIGIYTTRKKP